MLRALLMYVFGRAYGLPFKMATFIAKNEVIQFGLLGHFSWQQTYQVNPLVFFYVRMLRTTYRMEIYLVSLLPRGAQKSYVGHRGCKKITKSIPCEAYDCMKYLHRTSRT